MVWILQKSSRVGGMLWVAGLERQTVGKKLPIIGSAVWNLEQTAESWKPKLQFVFLKNRAAKLNLLVQDAG